eukprot:2889668-Rhodomonas_salina.1
MSELQRYIASSVTPTVSAFWEPCFRSWLSPASRVLVNLCVNMSTWARCMYQPLATLNDSTPGIPKQAGQPARVEKFDSVVGQVQTSQRRALPDNPDQPFRSPCADCIAGKV